MQQPSPERSTLAELAHDQEGLLGAPEAVYVEALTAAEVAGQGPEEAVRRRVGWGTWLCVAWLALVIVLAAVAALLPLPDPKRTGLGPVSQSFTAPHPFGLDDLCRDMLADHLFGTIHVAR